MTHNTSFTGDPSERQVPACDSLGHVSNATLAHERREALTLGAYEHVYATANKGWRRLVRDQVRAEEIRRRCEDAQGRAALAEG